MARRCGLSQFEFLLVVVVIAILALPTLERLHEIQESTEKTVVETTLRNITSGLRYAMSKDIISGEESRIAELVGSNLVLWLEHPPAGYIGEHPAAPDPLPPGSWFFDTTRRELCYRPVLDRHLTMMGGEHLLRWRIESSGDPHTGDSVHAVKVVEVQAYRWF